MSGHRGSPRKNRVKIKVRVDGTNRKIRGFITHIFLPRIHSADMIHDKLVKKFGSVAWSNPLPVFGKVDRAAAE